MRTAAIALAVAGCLWSAGAMADTYTWTGGGTGDNWTTPGNWDASAVPGVTDTAVFDADATVVVDTSSSVADMDVTAGTVSLSNAGGAEILTVANSTDVSAGANLSLLADLMGTGTVSVDGELRAYGDQTSIGMVYVNSGGTIVSYIYTEAWNPVIPTTFDLTIGDGTIYAKKWTLNYGIVDFTGNITTTGNVTLESDSGWDKPVLRISGPLTQDNPAASHQVTVEPGQTTYLSNPGNDYKGGTVVNGTLQVEADGAVGTGAITVNGSIYFTADQSAGNAMTVSPGGTVALGLDRAVSALNLDFTIGAGATIDTLRLTYLDVEYAGTVTLAGDATADVGGGWDHPDMYISGVIQDDGPANDWSLTKTGERELYLTNGGNTFGGGVVVRQGLVRADAAGALGTGTAVAAGGTIRSNFDDSFASVPQVRADDGGTVDLNSTENNATIHVSAGGGFRVSSGSTVLNYSETPQPGQAEVTVERGCVLDENLETMGGFPDIGDFRGGDDGYGAFVGATSGDWTVGDTSGTVFRGLGATQSATYSGTVTEAANGTKGIGMLASGPATFTYSNATFNTENTNTIKLYGKGNHVIDGAGNKFNNAIDMLGEGMLQVDDQDAFTASPAKTLNIYSGYLDVNHAEALSGAVVNVKPKGATTPGGVFYLDQTISTGSVNVEAGAGLFLYGQWFELREHLGGGAAFDFAGGSQLAFGGHYGFDGSLVDPTLDPAQGKASFLLFDDGRGLDTTYDFDLILCDDSRITYMPTAAGGGLGGGLSGTGKILLADGNTQCRVAAHGTYVWPDAIHSLSINRQIDLTNSLGVGKLIVGDPNPYHCVAYGGAGMADTPQDGWVYLYNPTNVIGAIDVQAGALSADTAGEMGNAVSINIEQGATWSCGTIDMAITVTGKGTVSGNLTVTPSDTVAAGISPGASGGILSVTGNLALASHVGAATVPSTMDIDVAGSGGIAGTDFDQVAVGGNLDVTGGDLVLHVPVPCAASLNPDELGSMIIASAGATLTGPFNAVTLGGGTDSHWVPTVDYDYGAGNITLELAWTGFGGDADLNGVVDYLDLGVLATYYDQTGMCWTDGDFTFDGKVDYMDLGILATNYDLTEPSGGAPVPAPAAVFLLAFGAVGLLRRRRRR